MCRNRATLRYQEYGGYWSSTQYSGSYYRFVAFFPNHCATSYHDANGATYARCVL
ncbi:MAG: hypothetical protein LBF90_06180 [Prevotellaceae bacterium]|nr:hypothetical protein [Prevotellaceae bacterium]